MTTENNAKNNTNARFKSVDLKKYYKQTKIIIFNFGGAPTGGGPGPSPGLP